MNVMISTPMANREHSDILADFKRINEKIRDELHICEDVRISVINYDRNAIPLDPVCKLGEVISKMPFADIIIFAKGFTQAKGCLCEYSIVNNYGDDWVKDPSKPNVYFETATGLVEARNRLERHRCFMSDQIDCE